MKQPKPIVKSTATLKERDREGHIASHWREDDGDAYAAWLHQDANEAHGFIDPVDDGSEDEE